jgi:hypothetical protein
VSDDAVFQAFLQLADRLALSNNDLATLTRLSVHTLRLARATKQSPTRPRCIAQIRAFVESNISAQSRGEVRLVA